jgi:hypothetical protein
LETFDIYGRSLSIAKSDKHDNIGPKITTASGTGTVSTTFNFGS